MIFFLSIFLLRSSIILELDIILVIDYKLDVGLEGDQMMVCCVFCCLMLKFQNKTVVCGSIIPRSQSSFPNLTCLAVRVSGAWRVKNSE